MTPLQDHDGPVRAKRKMSAGELLAFAKTLTLGQLDALGLTARADGSLYHDGPASLTDSLRDGWGDDVFYGEPEHAQANYTLAVVYPDGNPVDMRSFGEDLSAATIELERRRAADGERASHWMIHDADDGERGYFDPEPTDCTARRFEQQQARLVALSGPSSDAALKVAQAFSLDPDLPEGATVRFDERPLELDDTEIFGRPCPDGVDDCP